MNVIWVGYVIVIVFYIELNKQQNVYFIICVNLMCLKKIFQLLHTPLVQLTLLDIL